MRLKFYPKNIALKIATFLLPFIVADSAFAVTLRLNPNSIAGEQLQLQEQELFEEINLERVALNLVEEDKAPLGSIEMPKIVSIISSDTEQGTRSGLLNYVVGSLRQLNLSRSNSNSSVIASVPELPQVGYRQIDEGVYSYNITLREVSNEPSLVVPTNLLREPTSLLGGAEPPRYTTDNFTTEYRQPSSAIRTASTSTISPFNSQVSRVGLKTNLLPTQLSLFGNSAPQQSANALTEEQSGNLSGNTYSSSLSRPASVSNSGNIFSQIPAVNVLGFGSNLTQTARSTIFGTGNNTAQAGTSEELFTSQYQAPELQITQIAREVPRYQPQRDFLKRSELQQQLDEERQEELKDQNKEMVKKNKEISKEIERQQRELQKQEEKRQKELRKNAQQQMREQIETQRELYRGIQGRL